jgi:Glycosyl hydrolases family 15
MEKQNSHFFLGTNPAASMLERPGRKHRPRRPTILLKVALLLAFAFIFTLLLLYCCPSTPSFLPSFANMQLSASFTALAASLTAAFMAVQVQATVTDSYAYTRMVANIGGYSSNTQVPNVQNGAVIASPSTAHPNYFYSWVRDTAMTTKIIIDNYIKGTNSVTRTQIENIARAEVQKQQNAASSSSGLGEPKFNPDGR